MRKWRKKLGTCRKAKAGAGILPSQTPILNADMLEVGRRGRKMELARDKSAAEI